MSENGMNLGGLSSILQNPEIAAKLPRIMEAIAPVMAEMREEKAQNASAEKGDASLLSDSAPPDISALAATFGGSGKRGGATARRCALLRALEPYLSDSRKEAMEYILKVSSIIDIISEVM